MQCILPTCVIFVIVLVNAMHVDAAAYAVQLKYKKQYGESVAYCKHKGVQLLPGSIIKDLKKCTECTCTEEGYFCHDMAMSYTDIPSSSCKNVVVGCENKWVLRSNPKEACPDDQMPKEISAVGK